MRELVVWMLVFLMLGQSNLVLAAEAGRKGGTMQPVGVALGLDAAAERAGGVFGYLSSLFGVEPAPPPAITDAAVSLNRPSLNGGRIEGSLRVFKGENFSINSPFQLTGDLYTVGTPNVIVNSGAAHGGIMDDGGASTPSGWPLTLNSGLVLPGKIHKRADALTLPAMPTSVPTPAGTRNVNLNNPSDVSQIGNWATLRDLNVTPANLVIDVPPGNYGTFSLNGNSRLRFSTGTYNFSGTINLNSGATVETTGQVVVNIGQSFNLNNGSFILGANTLPGDVVYNVVSSSCSINNTSQLAGLLRAPNANVNFNGSNPTVNGQVIAGWLNMSGGKIVGNTSSTPPADTQKPTINITSPANGATTFDASITVNGTASDAGQFQTGITSVTVNNQPAAFNAATGNWTISGVALVLGANTITARATDGAGNQEQAVITVTRQQAPVDNLPPTVNVNTPADNSTVETDTVNVSGTVSDAGNPVSGVAQVTVNGTSAVLNAQAGTWSLANVPLNVGLNTLVVRAADVAGNVSADTLVRVTRSNPSDTQKPIVNINSPANNSTTYASEISVAGTATDDGQHQTGVRQVTVNGVAASYDPATGHWNAPNVSVEMGPQTITVVAVDNAGNQGTAQISVTRQEPPDTTAPNLSVTEPADGLTTDAETVKVAGTVSDTGPNHSGVASVKVNNTPAVIDAQAGTWSLANVPLALGPNTVTVRATDHAGNHREQTLTVTRVLPPDTAPPTIVITAPADNSTVETETVTVTGTASDDGVNAAGVRTVTVNGVAATYDPATKGWRAEGVALAEGPNTITVVATDAAPAANSSEAHINVTRRTPDRDAPVVVVNTPVGSPSTYDTTINVAGTAIDDGLNATGVRRVTVAGREAAYDPATKEWSLTGVELAIGENVIVVVATDGANPAHEGRAEVRVTRAQIPPPTLTVNNPQNGGVYTAATMTVAGNVSTLGQGPLTVTVNGAAAAVSGNTFTKTVTLADGANTVNVVARDSLGQETQVSVTVLRDQTAPAVSFVNVPANVQPGGSYRIQVDAADNVGVAEVEFRVGGERVAVDAEAPYEFTLDVPSVLAAGSLLTLTAIARDHGGATSVATALTRTTGPGGLSGYVFDDSTGYVIAGVQAMLDGGAANANTDAEGAYSLVSSVPAGVVRLTKEGFTPVERLYTVSAGEGTALFDARLTPVDSHANPLTPAGGAATGDGGRLRVTFNSGVLPVDADVRVTSVSPQGLANLLPYGWSPVPGAIVDVRVAGVQSFNAPVRLRVSQTTFPLEGRALVLAFYDEQSHGWKVVATGLAAGADGALEADLLKPGQYAFLVADVGTTAPPAPAAGAALTATRAADPGALDAARATAVSLPRTAAYSAQARATISFVADAPVQLPSGVSVEATFDETYNFLGGKDQLLVGRPAQDFVLYSFPGANAERPNRLSAFFVAKPTRTEFAVAELINANVHVEIRSGRASRTGALVGAPGGTVTAPGGARLIIPTNAVPEPQPVFFGEVEPQQANVTLPEGYEIVGAFDLDLAGGTLARAASISVPGFGGDASRVVVARLLNVGGLRAPELVARAAVVGGDLVSTTDAPAGVMLPGITAGGRYVFIRVPSAFGYVTGRISEAGQPAVAARVTGDRTPFADLTGADGRYLLLGSAEAPGANQLSAAATMTDATGRGTATLAAQDAVSANDIALASVALAVESVTPIDGAQGVVATTAVTVTFNKPVAPQTVTASNFKVTTANGNPVLGQITVLAGGRVAVFTPASTLTGSTAYRVSVGQGVRDIYAKPLTAAFASTFNTSDIVKVDDRLKPEKIRINYPDADGIARVQIPAASVPEGSLIIAVNETSGATVTMTAGSAGLELTISAQVGDQITLMIRQPDGIEYRVSQAAYRRADGFTSVGANGGTIVKDDGSIVLAVPQGAISGQCDIKFAERKETEIRVPRTGELNPDDVKWGGGTSIEVQGQFRMHKELHLEVAAPAWVAEGQRVAVMKQTRITLEDGTERDAWETVTSGVVENRRFKTTSPPFIGLLFLLPGFFHFDILIPRNFRAVYGTVKEAVPGQAPRPLAGVVCTIVNITDPETAPVVVTTTSENGGFGTFEFKGTIDTVIVRARDQRGRKKDALAAPDLNTNPFINPGLHGIKGLYAAVEFTPEDDERPENRPAVLRLFGQRTDIGENEHDSLAKDGLVSVGTEVAVGVDITPKVATFRGRLLVNGTESQTLTWEQKPPAEGYAERRVAVFRVPAQGSYTVEVETHTLNNAPETKARATYNFVGLTNPNVRPPLPGSPKVLAVTPPDGARQVDAGRRIRLEFSEPVKNLVAGETLYLLEVGTGRKIGGRLLSGGVVIGENDENISQVDFEALSGLAGGQEYEVHATVAITDTDGHALDQDQTSPDDTSPQPFKSSFKTFAGIVLTDTPVADGGHRIAADGQYAVTIKSGRGSNMYVYDMANPSAPEQVGEVFVPDYAIAVAMVEVKEEEENFKVGNPKKEYSRLALVTAVPVGGLEERGTNLWIFSLEDPTAPEMVGVVTLSFQSNIGATPVHLQIHRKRAYIANTSQGGSYAIDIEQALNMWAVQEQAAGGVRNALHPMTMAVRPRGSFAREAKRQTVTWGGELSVTNRGSAPANVISAITQLANVPQFGPRLDPVAYVIALNKANLAALSFSTAHDSKNGFFDPNGDDVDERRLSFKALAPAEMPRDVRAMADLQVKGRKMNLVAVLGSTRMWFFDVDNPSDPEQFESKSFRDLGFDEGLGYALRMEVEDTLAYIIFQNHIGVIDFADPEKPVRVATIASAGAGLKWVAVKDGFIYTLSNDGIHVSIARPASQVIVHGLNPGDDDRICANPVVLRRDNKMAQPAGVYFQVFGTDLPRAAEVVIRRERTVNGQHTEQEITRLVANIDQNLSTPKVIVGRATWNAPGLAIDRTWTYTAEVVFNAPPAQPGQTDQPQGDSEFHSRREPVPFSYLIAEAMRNFGSSGGKGYYSYVLGGTSNVTLTVEGNNILEDAADPRPRTYGLNADLVKHELADGIYPFTLRAVLEGDPSVTDEIEGELVVANRASDQRLPGHTMVAGVELQTGNLALTHDDLSIQNRGLSLALSRSYNTASANSFGPFGYGWSHNLQSLLVHDRVRNSYTMRGGDGSGQLFLASKEVGGRIEAEDPHQGTLVKNADGSFDFFTKAHVKYHFPGAMTEDDSNFFNLAYMGNLAYIEEPNGNRLTLTYDTQGRMTRVTDSSDRALEFSYEQADTPLVGVIAPNASAISCTNKGQFGLVRSRFLRAEVGKAWRIVKVKGPGGLVVDYEYDGEGNLSRAARAGDDTLSRATADSIWKYEYHESVAEGPSRQRTHLLRTVTSPNDTPSARRVTTYDYHFDLFRAPVKSVTFPESVSNRFAYTYTANRVTQTVVTDGRNHGTTYTFDREARTTVSVGPRGARTETVFNEKGQPSRQTDPEGTVTTTEYERGNVTSRTVTGRGQTATVSTRYDATFSKPISTTDPNGHTTSYALDSRGNVTLVTVPTGRTIRMSYGSKGDLDSVTDESGATTSYSYDQYGNQTNITRGAAAGSSPVTETRTYDERSRLLTSSGSVEPSVTRTYDALDRIVEAVTTDPSGIREPLTETHTYLPGGELVTSTRVSGAQRVSTTSTYDGLDRVRHVTAEVSGAGTFNHDYEYDENSNLKSEVDRRGVKTAYDYDELNFRTSATVTGPFGEQKPVSRSEVNLIGQPVLVTDVYGQQVRLEYDGLHRLVKRTLPGNYTEEIGYDDAGNVTSVKDRKGRVTTTRYDGVNRPVELRDPASRVTTWVYDDSASTVTEQQEPRGLSVTTARDALDRPVSERVKFDGAEYQTAYTYDGLTVRVTDPRNVVTTQRLSAFGETGSVSVAGSNPAFSTEARYTGFGGLKSSKDANGRASAYTVDGFNRPTSVQLPGGTSESFTYDGEGNVLSRTDRRGVRSEMTYDNIGRLLTARVFDTEGVINLKTVTYDDSALTETHLDPRGKPTVYRFDGLHRVVEIRNAAQKSRTLEYDGVNLVGETDFRGAATAYTYDAAGRVTEVRDRAGNVTTVNHSDSRGYTRTVTDRRGNQGVESFDALGRLRSLVRGGATVYTFEYDGNNNVKARVDGRNNRSAYEYDALNRVKTINHASGAQIETFDYDAVGNLLEHSDGTGEPLRRTYDELNHLKTETNGAGKTTHFRFDGAGLLLERTEPKGPQYKTSYQYNALGSLVRVTDAAQGVWELGYDASQNMTSVRDARQKTVSYEYDELNRPVEMRQPSNLVTVLRYDENGNLTSRRDPKGQETVTTYDALDRARAVTYAAPSLGTSPRAAGPLRQEFGYDPEGNLTDVLETTAAGSRRYSRTYDARNRMRSATDPFGHRVAYDYDAADNLTRFSDAANRESVYEYDGRNRMRTATLPGGAKVDYTRRADGLVSNVDYGAGRGRAFSYDGADRVTRVTNTLGTGTLGGVQSDEYVYDYDDNSNRRTETRKVNGTVTRSLTYDYDTLNRLTKMESNAPGSIVTAQGLRAEYFDDEALTQPKLTRVDPNINFAWAGTTSPDASVDGETFSARWTGKVTPEFGEEYTFYTRSDEGVRLWVDGQLLIDNWTAHPSTEDSGRISLVAGRSYDIKVEFYEGTGDAEARLMWSSASREKEVVPQSRLTTLLDAGGARAEVFDYEYDAVGNRRKDVRTSGGIAVTHSYVYDDLNRLTTANGFDGGSINYGYDENGNLTTVGQGVFPSAIYQYDSRDQLRRVMKDELQEVAAYDYDFGRRRLSKSQPGFAETRFVYSGERVVNEFDPQSRLRARYDYGEDLLRGEAGAEGAQFYFTDAQGSVTALANASGPSARYEYDPWGSLLSSSGASSNPFGYTGQRLDAETGLMPLGNGERYYSPGLGRFIQQDSWAGVATVAQSLNRYAYTFNNPLRYTDPSGNMPQEGQSDQMATRGGGRGGGHWWNELDRLEGLKPGTVGRLVREVDTNGNATILFEDKVTSVVEPEPMKWGGLGDFWEGFFEGDFSENETILSDLGRFIGGSLPYYGQAADVRDAAAAIKNYHEGKANVVSLVLAGVAFIPVAGDALKRGARILRRFGRMSTRVVKMVRREGAQWAASKLRSVTGRATREADHLDETVELGETALRNATHAPPVGSSRVIATSSDSEVGALLPFSSLNKRQRAIHAKLTSSGATAFFHKRAVSMTDLRAVGRVTGDEYLLFTRGSRRFVVRGHPPDPLRGLGPHIEVSEEVLEGLKSGHYGRWSGHTHPPGSKLTPGPEDRPTLIMINQRRSTIWGEPEEKYSKGFRHFAQEPYDDDALYRDIAREKWEKAYGKIE